MELTVFDTKKQNKGKVKLPRQFSEPVRADLINRAFLAMQSHSRSAYGPSYGAGLRHSARISKRRRDYRGSYGHGISRVPRKIMVRRGVRMSWTGAIIPSTVGGRRAHPPKPEKDWYQKINKKEKRKAIRSAMAGSVSADLVGKKHIIPKDYPFVLSAGIEKLDKTKQVKETLAKLGFKEELERVDGRKIRAGKGKLRGRKYKSKRGPLIVVGGDCKLLKAARNISGVEVADVKHINVDLLAPGGVPGRLTLWSKNAIDIIEKESLY